MAECLKFGPTRLVAEVTWRCFHSLANPEYQVSEVRDSTRQV